MNALAVGRAILIATIAVFFAVISQAATPLASTTQLAVGSLPQAALESLGDQPARLWTDANGQRQTTATLLAASFQAARLQKSSGKVVTVPLQHVCEADQKYIVGCLSVARLAAFQPMLTPAVEVFNRAERPVPGNMIYVRLSRAFLEESLGDAIQYQSPVVDRILGTAIYGQSNLHGRTELVLIPDSQRALGELRFIGTIATQSTGYNGPVRIFSRATTQFQSGKSIWIADEGFHSSPTQTKAETRSKITGIAASMPGLFGRIASNIASRRVAESHGQADYIAARHAEQRIGQQFDRIVSAKVTAMTNVLTTQFVALPIDDPLRLRGVRCATWHDAVVIAVLSPAAEEEMFVPPPVLERDRPDIEVHIHSAVVQRALTRPELSQTLRPVLDSIVASRSTTVSLAGSSQAPQLDVHWSANRDWLSLVWNREGGLRDRKKSPVTPAPIKAKPIERSADTTARTATATR